MKKLSASLVMAVAFTAHAGQIMARTESPEKGDLARDFITPPDTVKPSCYWLWLNNLIAATAQSGIHREAMTDSGLRYIRRQDDQGTTYFSVLTRTLAKDGPNLLEIEVANAPINRAADLDIRDIPWQKVLGEDARSFIIGDFLFPWQKKNAKWIPLPSGLLGPVQLISMKKK